MWWPDSQKILLFCDISKSIVDVKCFHVGGRSSNSFQINEQSNAPKAQQYTVFPQSLSDAGLIFILRLFLSKILHIEVISIMNLLTGNYPLNYMSTQM